jgi:3-oxoacyl-[acyl-carrier-protein] synthase-3
MAHHSSDTLPSLATRVKNKLQIKPKVCCLRYPFGCPGWIEGVLQANVTSNQEWRNAVW